MAHREHRRGRGVARGLAWLSVLALSLTAGEASARPTPEEVGVAWDMLAPPAVGVVPAGETLQIDVELRNVGQASWAPGTKDNLAYHWFTADGDRTVRDGRRTPLPITEAGGSAGFTATVDVPIAPGEYLLEWEPVREMVTWYGPAASGPKLTPVTVGVPRLGWSLLHAESLGPLAARQTATVDVTVRNEGLEPWSDAAGDRLSYRWQTTAGEVLEVEGLRTVWPDEVGPGDVVTVEARVLAPDDPGSYRLAWEPVREEVRWLGPPQHGPGSSDADAQTVEITPPQFAWELVSADFPALAWVGRTATVEVVLRNTGRETWSDATGDHLSYRWLREDGSPVAGDGRRTRFAQPVGPGETAAVEAHVRGPPSAGPHVLELDVVREHVKWFGAPTSGAPPRARVSVRWWSGLLALLLALLAAVAVYADRHRLHLAPRARAALRWLGWPLWTMLAGYVLAEMFADLSGLEPRSGSPVIAASVGGMFAAVVALCPGRARRYAALGVVALLTTLALADLAYISFFGGLIPMTALLAAHHLTDANATVAAMMRAHYVWLVVVPVSGVVLLRLGPVAPLGRRARLGVAAMLVLACLPAAVRLARAAQGELGNKVYDEAANAERFGYVGAHLFQIVRAVLVRSSGADNEARSRVAEYYAEREPTPNTELFGKARGLNAVLLQVEALQGWAVGARVGGQEITPFLNAASQRGLSFPHVFDQTGHGRTSDAEYLVLSSGHPLPAGALAFLRADNDFVTVAHALSQRGYSTLSAHPYKRGFWNRAAIHPRYGFDRSLFRRELGSGPAIGWGLADASFLERMAARLAQQPEPFFAFLITLSLHHPYDHFPDGFKVLDLGALEGTAVGNYLHAMHHFDAGLQQFVADLENEGLAERTVVMVFGDHVTRIGPVPEVLALAGLPGWDPTVARRLHTVPTFLFLPTGPRGEVQRVGGQVDLGATLLDVLGVPAPASFVGRPLTANGPGFAALTDGSAVGDDRMWIRQGRDIPRGGACFDYPSGRSRPKADCEQLAARAARQLAASRAVVDLDLATVVADQAD